MIFGDQYRSRRRARLSVMRRSTQTRSAKMFASGSTPSGLKASGPSMEGQTSLTRDPMSPVAEPLFEFSAIFLGGLKRGERPGQSLLEVALLGDNRVAEQPLDRPARDPGEAACHLVRQPALLHPLPDLAGRADAEEIGRLPLGQELLRCRRRG